MKVLWFCNTPANADEYFNSELKDSGGWLKALDQELQDHVELHIAFYWSDDKPFRYKKSYYHPLKTAQHSLRKLITRLFDYISYEQDVIKFLAIVNSVRPDVIHIHGTEAPFACIIPYTKIPVILSVQGNMTVLLRMYFNGLEKKYLKIVDRKSFKGRNLFFPYSFKANLKWYQRIQKLEAKNLLLVRNIMGRTDWDRRITRILAPGSSYFRDDRIMRRSFYENEWVPNSHDKVIIITTLSNNYYKGFETLCQALAELKQLRIDCEWRIIGLNQSDLLVTIIKKKMRKRYPKDRLILLGCLNEKEIITNLLESDLYVMTSHIENNANNLCEAMILGLPCISTFVGGIGSLIRDGEDGILIQSGDPWAMAGSIIELINDKTKAIQLGKNARLTALKRHNKERILKDLLQSYKAIINKDVF